MIKKRYLLTAIMMILLVIVGFKAKEKLSNSDFKLHKELIVKEPVTALVVNKDETDRYQYITPPYIGKSYIGFKEALAFRESRGNYFVVNHYGYLGKYQFGKSALKFYGIKSTKDFLNSPELQEKLFEISLERTKWVLRDEIAKYSGKKIGGVRVTESGILAAAHLAGAGNVKRFFRNKGKYRFRDAFGTSIRNYMRSFADYDLSSVEANENAGFRSENS